MIKISHFQKYCEKAIEKLSEDEVTKFKLTTREDERIKIMYDFTKTIPISLTNNGKNLDLAREAKEKGNTFFVGKKCEEALNSYNYGIIMCPQDSDAGKELLAILISNRSATYFEQEEFRKVFDDIDYVLSIGSYPLRLHYKIWLRKAKCYDALQNEKYAAEAYNLAVSSLKHAELDEKSLSKKISEIEEMRKNKKVSQKNHEIVPVSNSDVFTGGNTEYVAAHKNIYFDFDPLLGRFARAVENIETGVIIIEENPHCAVISQENSLVNCQFCCLSTKQPIACPNCGYVVFCSLNCERQANSTYHKIECRIQPILFQSGASINCSMALRMISQKPHGFFQQKKKLLKDFLKDNCKKVPIKSQIYRSDDYMTAFFLCRNEHLRKKGELVHYSVMAIYLLRLLKFAGYFGPNIKDDILTEEENFIASLILRHLQILQFNSHEISEIRNTAESVIDGLQTFYKSDYIGAGLYPTLALFNHSCDPSIVRYNIGSRMVVRTIKPVKAGDIIYENYGPMYTTMGVEERRANLQERYWFECYCTPCQEEWPLFENMDPNQIKVGCQNENCPFEFTLYKDDFCPYLQCDYCKTVTKIFPSLKGLSQLAILLPKAEDLYSRGEHREAMKLYMQSLDILYKYSKPPCPDMYTNI
ncbi:SET and MYND domain-containing protein 4 [Asbolus verrucosus]|uniref:Protein-lysine N-methyltransferase SMYD4 n=1 Tax=Asbolus verrucosus TaxID=1661398 RepID=A0A482WCL7_ASBVE|nr:SET and MYND domain-containing protein 4 [Asbolus verrucosus]